MPKRFNRSGRMGQAFLARAVPGVMSRTRDSRAKPMPSILAKMLAPAHDPFDCEPGCVTCKQFWLDEAADRQVRESKGE